MLKCANCGAEMIEAYTKAALRIYICPHTRLRVTKTINNTIRHGAIYCSMTIKGLKASFERLAEGSNLTLEALRQATNETVSDDKLLENANLALMLGLPANDLAVLFEAAMKLGYAMGIPSEKAIEALCRGVGRRSRLILDNIGIAFRAQEAYEWYAKQVEKPLKEIDRTEAWQKHAIRLIKEKAKAL